MDTFSSPKGAQTVKKTYLDECLERASKATEGPWEDHNWDMMERPHVVAHSLWNGKDSCNGHFDVPCTPENTEFIAHARTDVPELAKRLKKASHFLLDYIRGPCPRSVEIEFIELAKELEAPIKNTEHK